MLRSWLYFLSFFYTVNSFSTEEEKVKKECTLCYEDKDSRLLIEPKEIFSCQYMTYIPLLIDSKIINIKLLTLLDNFVKEEIINLNQKCYQCQRICNYKKISKIYIVPEILIISL